MSEIALHTFQSQDPETPFAPSWDYIIGCKQTDIDTSELAKVILDQEKKILEQYPDGSFEYTNYSDGSTGLGKDSLTSRYSFYNLLEWDYPVCKQLYENIRIFHNEYLYGTIGQKKKKYKSLDGLLQIRCWANVMRKGDKIKKHSHSSHPWTYLSGHFCVQCENTSTNYYHTYTGNPYRIENSIGQMTIFPTWVPHDTDKHEGDSERITIAFDIVCDNEKQFKHGFGKDPLQDNLIKL